MIFNNTIIQEPKQIILADSKIIQIGNHTSQTLDMFFKKLQYDLGCTYIFYIREDMLNDIKIIYSSNWKWQNLLIGEKFINDCPIFKAGIEGLAKEKKSILLPWNHIPCKTSKEKDITLLRTEFNIANGIGISHVNGHIREGIGLGADVRDKYFYQRLMKNSLIFSIMTKMRLFALRNAKNSFHSKKILIN